EDEHIRDIITHAGQGRAEWLFRYFLRYKVDCTGNWLPKTWSTLLGMAPDRETEQAWFDEMARYAPAVLDHLSDANAWLTDESHWRLVLSRLGADVESALLVSKIHKSGKDDSSRDVAIENLTAIVREGRAQLFGTYDDAREALKRFAPKFKG